MRHTLSFSNIKRSTSAIFAIATFLMTSQLFAQTAVNTATVTPPAGLQLSCVAGPAGTGLTYATTGTNPNATACSVTDTDTVLNRPTITKAFAAPKTIAAGGTNVLTITLSNTNAVALTGAAFTDTYPTQITNAALPAGSTTCVGGTVTAANNGTSVALTGGTIPANGSCTVTVTVTSATAGSWTNTILAGGLTTANGGSNVAAASDVLSVNPVVSTVSNATVTEGSPLVQTVTLSAATTQPVTYPFVLAGTTATSGTDFTNTPVFSNGVTLSAGVITVPAGVTSFTVTYPTIVDAISEGAETTALTVGGVTGIGTISDSVFLTVTKTVSQTPLAIGKVGQFYTITINIANGPTRAAMTIADVMPTGVTLSAAPTAIGGVLSGCPTTGSTLLGCTIATNAIGPVVITVPVSVGATAAGTSAVNSATVSGGGDPTCPAAAHCTGTVSTPVASPDMQVVPNTQLPNPVAGVPYPAGQTIACTNVSAVPAANAFCNVTDLPPGLTSVCSPTSPVLSLPAGGTIVCTISGTPTTSAPIKAKVTTGADGDTITSNNDGLLESKSPVGLKVAKSASANPLKIDAVNQYYSISIAVANGPTQEPIVLNDNFGKGITSSGPVTISGGTFKAGTCSAASGSGATTLSGCTIEAGVAGTVYINVPINVSEAAEGPTGGNNIVTASGGGDPGCPSAGNCIGSTGDIAVVYSDLGALFIRKVVDKSTAEIGDVLTYQLTVRTTKVKGAAVVNDKLPLGFSLISNSVRVSTGAGLVAASNPVGAPGPNLAFSINIPAKNQDVIIEYKVRVGMGADRGDGVNTAQASMRDYNLQSMIARAKVKVTGGVFTREACIVGKVYADCNGNNLQDVKEPGIANVKLYLENGTTITTDENGQYSMCGVRAITHVLKIDSATLPAGSVLGITSNRNVGDPNTLFVDVLAGQLHNADFRLESCTPSLLQLIEERAKGAVRVTPVPVLTGNGVQFDSSKPNANGVSMPLPVVPSKEGVK